MSKRDEIQATGAYFGASVVCAAAAATGWFGWEFGAAIVAVGLLLVAIIKAAMAGVI